MKLRALTATVERSGLSVSELSKLSQLSFSRLNDLLKEDNANVGLDTLIKLAVVLGIALDEVPTQLLLNFFDDDFEEIKKEPRFTEKELLELSATPQS